MFVFIQAKPYKTLARIKASASGAENPGFKSQRARHPPREFILQTKYPFFFVQYFLIDPDRIGCQITVIIRPKI